MTTTTEDQPALDGMPEAPPAPPAAEADPLPAPPKRGRTRKPSSTPADGKAKAPRARAPRRAPQLDIAGKVAEWYTWAALGVSAIPSAPAKGALGEAGHTVTTAIGQALAENAVGAGKAWAQLAEDNPQVKATLEKMMGVSVYGALLAAHVPVLLVAGVATGSIPPAVAMLLGAAEQEPAA